MYKFIKTPDEDNKFSQTLVEVTIPHNEKTWPELVEEFYYFLQGCGFHMSRATMEEYMDGLIGSDDNE
jgi:hypothetical protein